MQFVFQKGSRGSRRAWCQCQKWVDTLTSQFPHSHRIRGGWMHAGGWIPKERLKQNPVGNYVSWGLLCLSKLERNPRRTQVRQCYFNLHKANLLCTWQRIQKFCYCSCKFAWDRINWVEKSVRSHCNVRYYEQMVKFSSAHVNAICF